MRASFRNVIKKNLFAASQENSIYHRLTEALLSNYSSDVFPMTDPSQPLEVAVGMTLSQIVDLVSASFEMDE